MQRISYDDLLINSRGLNDFRGALLRNLMIKKNKWGLRIDWDDRIDRNSDFFDIELKINGEEFDVTEWFDSWKEKWLEDDSNLQNLIKREAEKMLAELNLKQFDETIAIRDLLDDMKKDILNLKGNLVEKCKTALNYQYPKLIDRYFVPEIEVRECVDLKKDEPLTSEQFIELIEDLSDMVFAIKHGRSVWEVQDSEECRRILLSLGDISKLKKQYEEHYELLKQCESEAGE